MGVTITRDGIIKNLYNVRKYLIENSDENPHYLQILTEMSCSAPAMTNDIKKENGFPVYEDLGICATNDVV
jgi:uncharacterized Fe-S center protein